MNIIEPRVALKTSIDGPETMRFLERCARTAYKSGHMAKDGSDVRLLSSLLERNPPHESVLEHAGMTVSIVTCRGVTHELVRHRLASYTQESTRYCNYSGKRFERSITVIRPYWTSPGDVGYEGWRSAMEEAESTYFWLLECGWLPEQARGVLPHDLASEIVMTANLREWRHILKLRCAPDAHPQMRQVMGPIGQYLQGVLPVVFVDVPPVMGPMASLHGGGFE